jgi:DNA-binding response OmpR family regulator
MDSMYLYCYCYHHTFSSKERSGSISVWKEQHVFYSKNTVMVRIRNIREKIESNPKEPQYIKTVWGVGYKIEK